MTTFGGSPANHRRGVDSSSSLFCLPLSLYLSPLLCPSCLFSEHTVNFFGIVRCCKAFLPIFKKLAIEGTHDGGRILNLTSAAGLNPGAYGAATYASSKHAAQALSQSLRIELHAFNVQVSTINPTFHGTPLVTGMESSMGGFFGSLSQEKRNEYGEGKLCRRSIGCCAGMFF